VSDDDMTAAILADADEKMQAAISHTQGEFGKIRTGRANPTLITDLKVDYYGAPTPLQQLANVSVPEPRMLVVNPFDASALKEIERAIAGADLGLNPSNDGQMIRVVFPELTEERRKEYVKLARERAEDGRVVIRNIRRSAKKDIDDLIDMGEATEDDVHRADKQLQDLTDKHVAQVDVLLGNKEKELLEV
jgi:ribosome recycling factor